MLIRKLICSILSFPSFVFCYLGLDSFLLKCKIIDSSIHDEKNLNTYILKLICYIVILAIVSLLYDYSQYIKIKYKSPYQLG